MSWDGENWEIFLNLCAFQTWKLNIFQNRPIALVIGVVTALIALLIQWSISVWETLNHILQIRRVNFNHNTCTFFLKTFRNWQNWNITSCLLGFKRPMKKEINLFPISSQLASILEPVSLPLYVVSWHLKQSDLEYPKSRVTWTEVNCSIDCAPFFEWSYVLKRCLFQLTSLD